MAAFTYSVNNRPTTGSVAMYLVLQNFISAGWVVKSSSDGTTYNSTGNQITSGSSGAGGLANNSAWFRIQDPGGGREFIVQRNASGNNYQWGIKYSLSAHFTGGSPSSTVLPTATDEVPILGTITGGGTTYTTFFNTTDNVYSIHMGMNNDGTIDYGFWVYAINNVGTPLCGWVMDFVQGADTGDLDPTVHYAKNSVSTFGNNMIGPNASAFFTSISSANFTANVAMAEPFYGLSGTYCGSNFWNGLEDLVPVFWYSSTKGWKGWSSLFMNYTTTAHNAGDVVSIGSPPTFGSKNALVADQVVIPWPPGTDCII